ncbi:MAG TPA: hypothetical protein VM841_11910, partial [Actinomycetota bacterium]|nr:hypothetical protein [Actinomycetota bacterium]
TVRSAAFDPAVVTAPGGDLIRWTVETGNHTIHAYAGATFAHSLVQQGDVVSTTFSGGTALYRCEFHSRIDARSLDCQGMCGAITDRTSAPAPAAITAPADGATIPTRIVRITGTAEPQTHAEIRSAGAPIGRALAGNDGRWAIDLDFLRGTHTIVARATHVNGRSAADSAPVTFHVTADTEPPAAFVGGNQLQAGLRKPGSVRGSATDDIALAWVDVRIARPASMPFGLEAPPKIVRVPASGTFWQWQVDGEVPPGVWAVSARATDFAGNVGEWSEAVVVVFVPAFPIRE